MGMYYVLIKILSCCFIFSIEFDCDDEFFVIVGVFWCVKVFNFEIVCFFYYGGFIFVLF